MCGLAPTDDNLLFEVRVGREEGCNVSAHSNPLAQEGAAAAAAAAAVAAARAAVGRGGSGGGSAVRYPDVPSFLKYARNRQLAHLQQLHQTKVPSVRNCELQLALPAAPTDGSCFADSRGAG
ncbi:unnamed protein product [Closterium sp. NIES-54]